MTTSVKLDERDKKRLDRLQARLTMESGEKHTQQEILAALISKGLEDGGLLDSLARKWRPLTDAEYSAALSLTGDWGVTTRSQDIDRVLYGSREG